MGRACTSWCVGVGGWVRFEPCVLPKMSLFHVIMSCLIVSVYNVHSGFKLRSIVTAHMNVLPNNNHCGPNSTKEFHNVKLALC